MFLLNGCRVKMLSRSDIWLSALNKLSLPLPPSAKRTHKIECKSSKSWRMLATWCDNDYEHMETLATYVRHGKMKQRMRAWTTERVEKVSKSRKEIRKGSGWEENGYNILSICMNLWLWSFGDSRNRRI